MATTDSFKAANIVSHFKQLKESCIERWWNNYVLFDWNQIRGGKNSTKWISIRYTPDLNIKPRKFIVSIRGEIHSGQIMPNTPEDVIELKSKNPEAKVELRAMKPSLQFQKWS